MSTGNSFGIIKPDAHGMAKSIVADIKKRGIDVVNVSEVTLTEGVARGFYAEHEGKVFFDALIAFMTSGKVVLMELSGENVVERYRKEVGATNPEEAEAGTIRAKFGTSKERNAVHASDSVPSAERELAYFKGLGLL